MTIDRKGGHAVHPWSHEVVVNVGGRVENESTSASVVVTHPRFLGTDTASPRHANFTPEDAGKTAHDFLRWENTRNPPAPRARF